MQNVRLKIDPDIIKLFILPAFWLIAATIILLLIDIIMIKLLMSLMLVLVGVYIGMVIDMLIFDD